MVERQRQDSSRDLLEELEDGWMTPPPPQPAAAASTNGEAREPASSEPDVDSLNAGWLDDLFPEDEDEDEDETDEEPEPSLPDERLDPEAYAAARKAREERAAKRKEKKRAKLEAKRARQKARAAAMRQKQKTKKSRSASKTQESGARRDRRDRAAAVDRAPSAASTQVNGAATEDEETDTLAAASADKPRASYAPPRRPSTLASIRLLAIVLGVMLALAAVVATIAK